MPPGHTLRGVSKETSILRADPAKWVFGCCDAILSDTKPNDPKANPFRVESITLDGQGVATHGVCCQGVMVKDSVLTNARCHALGVLGAGVVARSNQMLNSGKPNTVPGRGYIDCTSGKFGGLFEAAGIFVNGNGDDYGTVIESNLIKGGYGPALQVEGVSGGVFKNNQARNNLGWAAVSLYGASSWRIENNDELFQPLDLAADPYHADCAGGPIGPKSAGIVLCQDSVALATTDNQVIGNTTNSSYGILSIGADGLEPRSNVFQDNVVSNSTFGCADDRAATEPDQNTWSNNNCEGPADTPPGRF